MRAEPARCGVVHRRPCAPSPTCGPVAFYGLMCVHSPVPSQLPAHPLGGGRCGSLQRLSASAPNCPAGWLPVRDIFSVNLPGSQRVSSQGAGYAHPASRVEYGPLAEPGRGVGC
jgi:hypothetical protein